MPQFTWKVALTLLAAAALTTSANAHPKLKSSVPAAEDAVCSPSGPTGQLELIA